MDWCPPHTVCFPSNNDAGQSLTIKESLEQSASSGTEEEISRILSDINRLSDKDKLLLYLKMPVGNKASRISRSLENVDTMKMNQVQRSKVEAQQWLRANYEELQSCTVGRQEVYDHYRKSCELANTRCLNQQDFGKVLKHVFGSVTYRRLGNRSNSKFHYVGIRRLSNCQPPRLSSLDAILSRHSTCTSCRTGQNEEARLSLEHQAAERVVLKYVNGLVTSCFSNVIDAAKYLLLGHYVTANSLDVSILNCQSVGTAHADSEDKQEMQLKCNDDDVKQEESVVSKSISNRGESQRRARSSSAPTAAQPNHESFARPASLPADLLMSNMKLQQTPDIDVRFTQQQSEVTQECTSTTIPVATQVLHNTCSSACTVLSDISQLGNSDSLTRSLSGDETTAAEVCDEQRRPKFADMLQEIAQERCVGAGKITATLSHNNMSHALESNGIQQRKRRVRFQDADLQNYSKLQPLADSLSAHNYQQPHVGQRLQPFVVQSSTNVTNGNNFPIDRSRYGFIPIPMSFSPLEQSVQHDSHSSPITEILGMSGQPRDLLDMSARSCVSSTWSSVGNCSSEIEFSRTSLTSTARIPVAVENVRDSERFIQPSRLEYPKYPSKTEQACSDLTSSSYDPSPSSYNHQSLLYNNHSLLYNPPPTYDQAVAHIVDDKLADNVVTTSQHSTTSFPAVSLTNVNGNSDMHSNAFLDVTPQTPQTLFSVESYYGQGLSTHKRSDQCLNKQNFVSLDHVTTNPSTRYAGRALSPWYNNRNNMNVSAFRQVPSSTQSGCPPCMAERSSSSLRHSRNESMSTSGLPRALLSPFSLLSSVTESNDDETSQECSGYSSSLSSAADDVQSWGVEQQRHWQF